jgi:hypothetical protein
MSRTYRKHKIPYNQYKISLDRLLDSDEFNSSNYIIETIKKDYWRYNADTDIRYDYCLPKHYRKYINKSKRRTNDKQELYKEIMQVEYVGNYSTWNCKDSNEWGYW